MNNKILIGIVIFLILVGGVYLFLQQNQLTQNTTKQTEQNNPSQQTSISTECTGEVIPSLTEGPYYTENTPQRTDIKDGAPGEPLTLTGFVYDENCKPIANAWIDFWQADGEGNYDNSGYRLRGHQYTDASGKYILQTVIPGEYPGRTPHIHLKIRASDNSPLTTSQLFLPEASGNESDSIFDERLIIAMQGKNTATYIFVIPTK